VTGEITDTWNNSCWKSKPEFKE